MDTPSLRRWLPLRECLPVAHALAVALETSSTTNRMAGGFQPPARRAFIYQLPRFWDAPN